MTDIRKAIVFSFAERYTALVINIASMMVLARLLTPRDIGIFSVVAVLVGIADMIRSFGVGQYLIQEKELTPDKIRTAFSLTLIIAWLVAGIMLVSSGFVANFYREPGVRQVMRVLACKFFLIPFGSITIALLRRDLNFRPVYYIFTASGIIRPLTTIVLAVLGFGYMSPAWGALAGTVISVLVASLYRPKHLPLFPALRGGRRVFAFGSKVSAARIVQEAGFGAPDLILGRALTMEAVGVFGRAMGLIQLFDRFVTQAILPAVLPHLSGKYRAGVSVREPYLRVLAYQTGLAWPFYGFVGVMAYPIIRLFYGSQWDAAVPVVKILCVYAAVSTLYAFLDQVLIAVGAVGKNMQFQCISVALKFALVLLAVPFGLSTVAYALLVLSTLEWGLSCRFLRLALGIRLRDVLAVSWKSVCVFFFSMIGPLGVALIVEIRPDPYIVPFLLTLVVLCVGWTAGVFIVEHPLKDELVPLINKAAKRIGVVGV